MSGSDGTPGGMEDYNEIPERYRQFADTADDDEFRNALELTPVERDMLDQYGPQDSKLHGLDSALKDAVQMVRVSDQRISYLRKMHALLLLKRVKEALDTYGDDEAPVDGNPPIGGGHSRRQSAAELGDGFSLYSGSDSDNSGAIYEKSEKGPMLGSIRGMDDGGFRQSGKSNRSGRLGSEFGTNMSRGTSIGKETYMEDDALLNEDEDEDQEYQAPPFYQGVPGFGAGFEGDDAEKPLPEGKEAVRFPHKYKRLRKVNILGLSAYIFFVLAFGFYMYIRVTKTLGLGSYLWYGCLVLAVEVLGATTTLIYGMNLIYTPIYASKSKGKADKAEADIEAARKDPDFQTGAVGAPYHVRVLIPCYKEPYEIVQRTIAAIRDAVLPAGCSRTIYVCDDGKDRKKRRLCQRLGRDCIYVSGRKRASGEINGKSGNLNNACRQIYPDGCAIPATEVICVMDADQVADPTFFLKMLPMMDGGDDVGMVLSPQCFHNLNLHGDIFNHQNIHFWEYMQPGYDALGFISCTGTNFLIRSKAFSECGWSPEYTLTEDYALGMELNMREWQCRYMPEYLAVGEAPEQVRNCFQQRSRWCKGHYQVIFSRQHCPLFQRKLGLMMKVLYCSGVWSYIVASIATPTFILVPLGTIWIGIFPIVLSWWAALGLSVYYVATTMVLQYSKSRKHVLPLWFSAISTSIMWWTYVKAFWRAVTAAMGFSGMKFKTTLKGATMLAESAVGDLWMPLTVFVTLAVTLGIGLAKFANSANLGTTLIVSLLWIVYNMVPPYLLIHYTFIGRGTTLKLMARVCFLVTFTCGLGAIVIVWLLYPKDVSYPSALKESFLLYNAEQVGTLPANFPIDWRGNAYLQDGASTLIAPNKTLPTGTVDVSGGWMVGGPGGNIKMTQSTAFTVAMLAWGLSAYPKAYSSAKATNAALTQVEVGIGYLQKTMVGYTAGSTNYYLVYQVGNISTESRYWGYPENFTAARPSYYVPTSFGVADLAGSMSAAFSSSAMAFRSTNKAYAQGLLDTAVDLYKTGQAHPGLYLARTILPTCYPEFSKQNILASGTVSPQGVCASPYDSLKGSAAFWYNSTSYLDDMAWAATWLYSATGQIQYLSDAYSYWTQHRNPAFGESMVDSQLLFNWNNVFWGTTVMLAKITNQGAYHQLTQSFLKPWLCGTTGIPIQITPLGRSWNQFDGTMGTTANAMFLSSIYGQAIYNSPTPGYPAKGKRYVCWARVQSRYMLGESGADSFVVGFSKSSPKHAQNMGASCRGTPSRPQVCDPANALFVTSPNPHSITGALVEQNAFSDILSVSRASNNSRVAPEYNAGFAGAVAGLITAPGTWAECLQGSGVLTKDTAVCLATV